MDFDEIYGQKWEVDRNLEVNKNRLPRLSKVEQEYHINILASGVENPKKEEMHITCSIPKYITKLARNSHFKLRTVLISCSPDLLKPKVLQVEGIIYDTSLFSLRLRKKKRVIDEEQKKVLVERLKKYREKRSQDKQSKH